MSDEDENLEPIWTKVPSKKRNPFCGFCGKKLSSNEYHWRYDTGSTKKEEQQIYWWCSVCIPPPKK